MLSTSCPSCGVRVNFQSWSVGTAKRCMLCGKVFVLPPGPKSNPDGCLKGLVAIGLFGAGAFILCCLPLSSSLFVPRAPDVRDVPTEPAAAAAARPAAANRGAPASHPYSPPPAAKRDPPAGVKAPPPTKAQPKPAGEEEEAARKLRLAKLLLDDADTDIFQRPKLRQKALDQLSELLSLYPDTEAAREARELVDKLSKKP